MKVEQLRCVVFNTQRAYVTTIPNTLKALQNEVHGLIEAFKTKGALVFLCNEEGAIHGMADNPYFNGIVGPVVAVSSNGEEFASLSDAEIEWIKEHIIRE